MTYSQTLTFPVEGKYVNDISSSFGPRNLGPTANDNYPDADYDYDFHCALDIAASPQTDVLAVWDGVVVKVNEDKHYVIIRHTDSQGDFWVKYQHIDPTVKEKNSVRAGGKIGYIQNITHPHLDIRYYPWEAPRDLDENAVHPYDILAGMDCSAYPIIVDKYGNVMHEHYGFTIESDDCTLHKNPAGADYFELGVRVYRVECDLQGVDIYMTATDASGNRYNEKDLLNTSNVQYQGRPNTVDYFPYKDIYDYDGDGKTTDYIRLNCGDRKSDNDDFGHNSTSVGIYPRYLGDRTTIIPFTFAGTLTNHYGII